MRNETHDKAVSPCDDELIEYGRVHLKIIIEICLLLSINSATDADEGVNAALRYSIIGGNSQNHFSIDGLTGEVSLLKSLDFESVRSYRLNIRAIGKYKVYSLESA